RRLGHDRHARRLLLGLRRLLLGLRLRRAPGGRGRPRRLAGLADARGLILRARGRLGTRLGLGWHRGWAVRRGIVARRGVAAGGSLLATGRIGVPEGVLAPARARSGRRSIERGRFVGGQPLLAPRRGWLIAGLAGVVFVPASARDPRHLILRLV